MRRLLRFESKYLSGQTPWDTGITPPEVIDFLEHNPRGRAIDFGCGTGTNALTMARYGWEVVGVDFSRIAIARARRKARAAGIAIRFLRRDVSRLTGVDGPFDLALDIGCFHGLEGTSRSRYASVVAGLLRPGGTYLLYTFLDPEGGWADEAELDHLFGPSFTLERLEHGEFDGHPSGWCTWKRRA